MLGSVSRILQRWWEQSRGGIHLNFPIGRAEWGGSSAGILRFGSRVTQRNSSETDALTFRYSKALDVITNSTGALRQILVSQGLSDIVPITDYEYEIGSTPAPALVRKPAACTPPMHHQSRS